MARYFHYLQRYGKCLDLMNIGKSGLLYSPLKVLCPTSRIQSSLYSCNIHTFAPLKCNQNNEKSKESTSINKSVGSKPTEIDVALNKLKIQIGKGNTNNALEIYAKWNKKSGFHETDFAFLTLVSSLINAGRWDEAKKITTEFNNNDVKSRSTNDSDRILCSIFHSFNTQSFDELRWFVDNLIFTRKYMDRRVLEVVMKTSFKLDDLNASLDLFIRIAEHYRVTPLLHTLTSKLIYQNDSDSLEKLLSISSAVNGQMNSFYDMALNFTVCGRTDQAKKIFLSLEASMGEEKIENFIENLKQRNNIKALHNFLTATENFASHQQRKMAYIALLELYAYANNSNQAILDICSAMNRENIIPDGQHTDKITAILKRKNIAIPKSWLQCQIVDRNSSDSRLHEHLIENNILEANQILYASLDAETPLPRNVIKFCLLKNADHGNIAIFEDLDLKFDSATKTQLYFYKYESIAYLNAKKGEDYLQLLQEKINKNQSDLKGLVTALPLTVIEMIESQPSIYDKFLKIAKEFAGEQLFKPLCLAWTYNFINSTNCSENDEIWDNYLKQHPTIVCKQVSKILSQRKEIVKLRMFLNSKNLKKKYIMKSELGKAYSILFDALIFAGDYDTIIDEVPTALEFVSLKDFKSNTLNRIKLGPEEFSQRFWNEVNKTTKISRGK